MSGPEGPHDDARHPDLAVETLARDLAELTRSRIVIPDSVDDAIHSAAHSTLAPPRGRLVRRRWLVVGSSLAASIALLVSAIAVLRSATPTRLTEPATATVLRGDLDGNGAIDVLDAFMLARQLDAGTAAVAGDLNGDGVIDRDDVDAIAMIAVTLPEKAG